MRDLNRYVTRRYATDWYDIGIELGLELDMLDIIKKDNPQQSVHCFQKTLDKWLKLNTDATWKTLEVALTNVNRAKLGLDPVDDVYGEDTRNSYRVYYTVSHLINLASYIISISKYLYCMYCS